MNNILETLVSVKNIKGTSFVGVKGYENKQGEVSNQTLVVGITYENALLNDLKKLKTIATKRAVVKMYNDYNKEIVKKGYTELVASLEKRTSSEDFKQKLREQNDSTINRSDSQKEAYTNIAKGLKVKDNQLYIYGIVARKTILKSIEYKKRKSADKTIIKGKITKQSNLSASKFKSFVLNEADTLNIKGSSIDFKALKK